MAKQTTSTFYCDAKGCQASLSESGAKSKALTDTKALWVTTVHVWSSILDWRLCNRIARPGVGLVRRPTPRDLIDSPGPGPAHPKPIAREHGPQRSEPSMGYDIYRLDKDLNRLQAPDADGPVYFRRNIWGGGALAEALEAYDLGYWSEVPNWRDAVDDLPQDGEGDDSFWYLPNSEQFKLAPKYKQHLTATYSETPGIALHKIAGSNDGWIITAAEYQSMLGLFDQLPERVRTRLVEETPAFGREFLTWAKACAKSGGSETN